MNGREFLPCAVRLFAGTSAADLRSAVSRAYYAAFHAALDFFGGCGVMFSKNSAQAHTKMPDCLDNTRIPAVIDISTKLRSLRSDRNCADYQMSDAKFEKEENVRHRIEDAEEIIALIDALRPDHTTIRKALRPQARLMGLNVTGVDD
jgi:uncharacterized protein (UPF0332 family)